MAIPRSKKVPQTIDVTDVFPEETGNSRPAVQQALPPPRREPEFLDESLYDDVTALNTVLSELGALETESKGFITVYREVSVGSAKNEVYLSRFDVMEYSEGNLLDHLQYTYGAGRYHIRVYRPEGSGLAANKWITIADNPNMKPKVSETIVSAPGMDMAPILQTMQVNFEKMFEAMRNNQPQQNAQPTFAEKLEEMRILSEMLKGNQPAAQTVNYNPIEMMKLGMEMAQNSSGDGNNMWVSKVLETFAPVILESISRQNAATPRVTVARPALPTKPAEAGATQQQPTEQDDDAMKLMLTGYLKMLNGAAKQDKPVEEYADTILNLMPASEMPAFEKMLRAPDWQTQFSHYSPAVNTYPGWYENLKNVLIEFIDEDQNVGPDTGNVSKDTLLTGGKPGDTVPSHENDNTRKPAN